MNGSAGTMSFKPERRGGADGHLQSIPAREASRQARRAQPVSQQSQARSASLASLQHLSLEQARPAVFSPLRLVSLPVQHSSQSGPHLLALV